MSAVTSAADNGDENAPMENEPPSKKFKSEALQVPRGIPWWKDVRNLQDARCYIRLKGLLFVSENNSAVNPPLTLQPHNYPQELYEELWALQPIVHSLVDAVSRDLEFLEEALARVIKVDDFTFKLFKLLKDSQSTIAKTVISIHRADYMMDYRKGVASEGPILTTKQTEVNPFAVGIIAHEPIQDFHEYLHSRFFGQSKPLNIPAPSSIHLVDGIATVCRQYGKPDAYVLFINDHDDWNIYGIHDVKFQLWTRYQVKSMSRTLQEVGTELELGDNEELFVSGQEVAVVYYRSGYGPEHYSSEKDWSTRLLMECSRAISCPSVAYQLAGTKKVQQVLAAPGVLERFIDDPEVVKRVRATFTGLYSLDRNPEGDRNLAAALQRPDDFVLKCQREGGNNNIYGSEIRTLLASIESSDERENYILMDRIRPPTQHGVILRKSSDEPFVYDNLFTEVGICGVYVRQGDKVLLNEAVGFLARSKQVTCTADSSITEANALSSLNLMPTAEFLALTDKEE